MSHWPKGVRWRQIMIALVLLAPPALMLVVLRRYGVLVPFWDQWELVPFIGKLRHGTLGLSDLWSQHNEHRILFPRIIMLSLASLTKWNTIKETYVNVALAAASTSLIAVMLRRSFAGHKKAFWLLAIFGVWIMYSPIQWENWLWGWQIQWFLSIAGVIGTVWAIDNWPTRWSHRWRLVAGAAFALLATYSLANGVMIWPIGFVMLVVRRERRQALGAWALAGTLSAISYFYHYANPGYEPSKSLFLHQPKTFVHYVLVYIGRPIARDFRLSAILGAVIIMLFAAAVGYLLVYRKGNWLRCLSWLGLAAYAGIGAVTTAISRLGFGVVQGFSSRYTTVSSLFLLATIVLLMMAAQDYYQEVRLQSIWSDGFWMMSAPLGIMALVSFIQGTKPDPAIFATTFFILISVGLVYSLVAAVLPRLKLRGVLTPALALSGFAVGLGALIVMNYIGGFRQLKQQSAYLTKINTCVYNATSPTDPCLTMAYPNAQIVWTRIDYLRSIGWGGLTER